MKEGQMQATLEQQNEPFRDIIEVGDFAMNLLDRTATLRGQRLDLSFEEFDVLLYLAGHPKSQVTPHTVLATKWIANQPRKTVFLRVLASLRKKLEAREPGNRYLRTEASVRYFFNPASV
jgi:DNA-binding response OmpR family regulator